MWDPFWIYSGTCAIPTWFFLTTCEASDKNLWSQSILITKIKPEYSNILYNPTHFPGALVWWITKVPWYYLICRSWLPRDPQGIEIGPCFSSKKGPLLIMWDKSDTQLVLMMWHEQVSKILTFLHVEDKIC